MAGAGYKLFNTGDVLTAAQVNTYLMQQTVMVFASATARTTALSGVLAEGMLSYLQDTNAVEKYDGSAWVAIAAGDIEGVTASTPLTGGGTSGTVTIGIQDASTTQKGAVQLTDSTSSTSTTTAATPNSVKSAYDLANGAIAKSLVDAKGDLIVASADNTVARLAVGSNNQILTADSTATNGIKWAAAPSSSPTSASSNVTTGQSTTSTTFTDLTTSGPSVTVTTGTKALVIMASQILISTNGNNAHMSFEVSGATTRSADDEVSMFHTGYSNEKWGSARIITGLTAGSNTFTAKYRVSADTGTFTNRHIAVIDLGS